jgi:hypothetical protein
VTWTNCLITSSYFHIMCCQKKTLIHWFANLTNRKKRRQMKFSLRISMSNECCWCKSSLNLHRHFGCLFHNCLDIQLEKFCAHLLIPVSVNKTNSMDEIFDRKKVVRRRNIFPIYYRQYLLRLYMSLWLLWKSCFFGN